MYLAPYIPSGTTKLTGDINDKRGFAARWGFSVRHIDSLIRLGLPVLRIGSRRVRIIVAEADGWMRARFGTQQRGPARTPVKLPAK